MPEFILHNERLDTTTWFAASSRPTREGVYERRAWNADAQSPREAAGQESPSDRQDVSWRGLSSPHDAPCATCRGHTVVDRGVDADSGADDIAECPDC